MFRLHGARFALAAASLVVHRSPAITATPLRSVTRTAVAPLALSPVTVACRRFSASSTMLGRRPLPSLVLPARSPRLAGAHGVASAGFLRGARLSACVASLWPSQVTQQLRAFRVKGQEKESSQQQQEEQQQEENKEEKAKAEGEKAEEEEESSAKDGKKAGKGKKGKASAPRKGFMDHIRGLREDYATFPHIYNSANMINFVIFTVFCLCSTGSVTEEEWWMKQWGLDNAFRPWTWLLHSCLTNNFLSMSFAMMLLHTMCHQVLPTLGSRGLMLYCGSTAVISGAVMWLGNWLYYGSGAAPEKQFGPWDVVSALFVMEYFYYGLTPFTILSSFSGWIKYAMWVGEVCILYFDWQPTVVGTLVGLALCRGVPRFKVMKPAASAGAK